MTSVSSSCCAGLGGRAQGFCLLSAALVWFPAASVSAQQTPLRGEQAWRAVLVASCWGRSSRAHLAASKQNQNHSSKMASGVWVSTASVSARAPASLPRSRPAHAWLPGSGDLRAQQPNTAWHRRASARWPHRGWLGGCRGEATAWRRHPRVSAGTALPQHPPYRPPHPQPSPQRPP